jgi:hypothetical protein
LRFACSRQTQQLLALFFAEDYCRCFLSHDLSSKCLSQPLEEIIPYNANLCN